LLERSLPFVAQWGAWILAALVGLSILVAVRLGRRSRGAGPPGWPLRLAAGGAPAFALAFAAALCGVLGPMRPMLDQVRSIEGIVGRPAGDLAFIRVADGSPVRLGALRGNVVLVNLWATWCAPCRHELPELNRLQRDYAGRGLVVVTVSNEEPALLARFAVQHPFATTNVRASSLGWLDVAGRPISVAIDRGGVVRGCMIGARTYPEFRSTVEGLLRSGS